MQTSVNFISSTKIYTIFRKFCNPGISQKIIFNQNLLDQNNLSNDILPQILPVRPSTYIVYRIHVLNGDFLFFFYLMQKSVELMFLPKYACYFITLATLEHLKE